MTNPTHRLLHPHAQILALDLFSPAQCRTLIAQGHAMDGWTSGTVVQQHTESGTTVEQTVTKYRSVQMLKALPETTLYDTFRAHIEARLAPACANVYDKPFVFPGFVNMLTYHAGDYHRPHRDVGPGVEDRLLTVVCYLNDTVTGGSTIFPDYGVEVVPRTGQAIVFPSAYLHGSTDIIEGQKHALVCWLLEA